MGVIAHRIGLVRCSNQNTKTTKTAKTKTCAKKALKKQRVCKFQQTVNHVFARRSENNHIHPILSDCVILNAIVFFVVGFFLFSKCIIFFVA